VIEDVSNAQPPRYPGLDIAAESSLFNKLYSLDAGDTAHLKVLRHGIEVEVSVRLRSMRDADMSDLIVPSDDYSAHTL
jgi:hypothetical protein